ncbi:hypothetical protein [Staphylococcus aureus]|uniref:Uncharacterized protein n=1 Tax=Staphylococcus aureus TaxID=1280 RepID=A0A380EM81_STAAU|nr:hypothetical protein [Staphylococcus aureus]SUL36933.1 Uncharacterised protein [Staphylococcus aureus]
MAAINDLLRQIPDTSLRNRLEQEFARISKNKNLVLYLRSTSLNALHFMKFLSNVARLLHKKQATLMMYIRY